jgi:hypothetical protein
LSNDFAKEIVLFRNIFSAANIKIE